MLQISWPAVAVLLTTIGMLCCASAWIINLRLRALEQHVRVMLAEQRAQLLKDINGAYVRRDLFESRLKGVQADIDHLQDGQTRLMGQVG